MICVSNAVTDYLVVSLDLIYFSQKSGCKISCLIIKYS